MPMTQLCFAIMTIILWNDSVINSEINKIYNWLCSNKLSLNVSKTKIMCFHAPQKVLTYPILKINSINIERVTDFNFWD